MIKRIETYVEVEVCLSEFTSEELLEELESRGEDRDGTISEILTLLYAGQADQATDLAERTIGVGAAFACQARSKVARLSHAGGSRHAA